MIEEIRKIIDSSYLVDNGLIDQDLILNEDSNIGNQNALSSIKLRIGNKIKDFAVYKFDQKVTIQAVEIESYAPFLQPGSLRSMCDFIIFFHQMDEPDTLCTWVVNLKSKKDSNNLQQMRSGRRLTEFLLGKMEDNSITSSSGKNINYKGINYILFSLPKPNSGLRRPTTNALLSIDGNSEDADGKSPENFFRIVKSAYKLKNFSS